MVQEGLSRPRGGAGSSGTPARGAEHGSQSVEFALVLPLVMLLLGLVLQAGLFGADLVAAQGLVREAARAAAVADDDQVRERVRDVAGARPVTVRFDPPSGRRAPGDLVTVHARVRSRAFEPLGIEVWLPAQATMLVEDV